MPPQPRKIVRIVRVKPTVSPGYTQPQPMYQPPVQQQEDGSGCLCAILGGLFGPLGMIVAAIIGKKGGVIAALFGWVVSWLLVGLTFVFLFGGLAIIQAKMHG